MHIHFGIHTDHFAQLTDMPFGEITLGRAGLLNVLETQLGLPQVEAGRARSLMAYRACFEAAQDRPRFYDASFQTDPVGVTRTLLHWREQWYEHGWAGAFLEGAPARLADMAAVEQRIDSRLLCEGQRLQRVLDALRDGRTQIQGITLLSPHDELPKMWRRVVDRFPCREHDGVTLSPAADPGTDLHAVQAALLDPQAQGTAGAGEKIRLANDGSVVLVRGVSRDISAQAVAEYVRKLGGDTDALVIAERDGIILDNALARVSLPRAGFPHYSRFRAAGQVLKLGLGLVWSPVNPRLLLQFLLHPVGPVHRRVRNRLAEVVAGQPGVGGEAWQQALGGALEKLRETTSPEHADEVGREARYWLESPRYSPGEGAPLEVLIERAQACANWLTARLNTATDRRERESYASAFGQARDLVEALKTLAEQGHARLAKVELDRMLDEATYPLANPELFSEAGHVTAAEAPETLTSQHDHVLWWDIAFRSHNLSYPWSAAEIEALHNNGVELPATETLLQRRARDWLRPVMQARRQLVLVFHENEKGDHPLVNQVRSLFEGLPETRLDNALLTGAAGPAIPALDLPTIELTQQPLPPKRRWWQLEDATNQNEGFPLPHKGERARVRGPQLKPRETEPYSSLENLLNHPHIWLLNYAAKLRQGSAEDLADGALLYGNLAHRLFERFFNEHRDWHSVGPDQAKHWLSTALDSLIETEGAPLLQPGQAVQHERVAATIERALLSLLRHLRAADIATVAPEFGASAPFKDNRLAGKIDLLLTDAQGRDIVLDVKWGGEKYRGDALRENRHLQLAAYAWLRRANETSKRSPWPHTAYFIIESGNVLAQDNTVFPDARILPPEAGGDLEDLWRRVGATYDWRWQQLAEGRVEVVAAGTEPDPGVPAPDDGFPVDPEPDRFDPFTILTGWEPSQ